MKNFLWIWIAVIPIVLGFSCIKKMEWSSYRSPRANQQESVRFKMPDAPTNPDIYETLAEEYVGIWKYKANCGNDHNGKGSHNINGVIVFKDNGQFEFEFETIEVSSDSLVYRVKRDGYWTLTNNGSFINMSVVHELNSKMEITIIDPKAALKIYFKVFLDDPNNGQYRDEYDRLYDFKKEGSKRFIKRNGLKRI